MSRKYEKYHLFDANICYVGRSRPKKSLVHSFLKNQYSSQRETIENNPFFWNNIREGRQLCKNKSLI